MNIVESVSWTKYVSGVPTYKEKLVISGSSLEDKGSLLAKNEGSIFTCSDNGDSYVWSGTAWWEVNNGIKEYYVGNLHELDTTEKDTIVAAINNIWTIIGDLATLDTTENETLVGAINEVLAATA